MKKIFFIWIILAGYLILNGIEVKSSFFGYTYDKSAQNKYGVYADTKVTYGSPNDKFCITFSQNTIVPKKYSDYIQKIERYEVRTDSVYYHNVWIDETYYETFVYDTTFVDTNYTVLDTIKIEQPQKSQYEFLLNWTHRQFLWYYFGFGFKYSYFKNNENAWGILFYQDFYKTYRNITFSYTNSLIGTFLNYHTYLQYSQTDTSDFVYNTTQDSLYLYQPDSVLTFVHYEDSYENSKLVKKNRRLMQVSNVFGINYKKLSLALTYDFLIDKHKFGSWFSGSLSYKSYLYSLDLIYATGQSELMYKNGFTYFDLEKEKLLYSISSDINFYPLNKKWNVKIGLSYSKYDILRMKGLYFELGIKL